MSVETFQRILALAANNAAFADPERALAGCNLTHEEALTLKLTSRSDLNQYILQSQPRPIPPAAVAIKNQRSRS